ncbi:hypothetical protein MKX07_005039 [Trichoderma sp. CBMAI-0711]|nr:hypothetical protein MKX07_005039 [Trichoderma sp. CBMAI-0711]
MKRGFTSGNHLEAAEGAGKRLKTRSTGRNWSEEDLPRKRNDEYTVGWICAVVTEYVAAQAVLDELHGRPKGVSPASQSDFTLGRIGEHNVVIASLPFGEYGTASAATVANDMSHNFPNIRFRLMVGIGGGAPNNKHDIRLGDVVVSAPCNGHSGVMQYDFGKTVQGQPFQPTRYLDQPPMVLRTAMSGLAAQYEHRGHRIEDARQALQQHLRSPLNGSADREVICGGHSLIVRPPRPPSQRLVIHYGLVASSNQLMKDAIVRDHLSSQYDILCFEMEAGGLMNQFPCLVIRGICDYSDSHKNKAWQGYAAMTAAAYAEALIKRVSPPNSSAGQGTHNTSLSTQLQATQDRSYTFSSEERCQLLKSLRFDQIDARQMTIKKAHVKTCQWLLQRPEYLDWLDPAKFQEHHGFLWIKGKPGTGKSTLMKFALRNAQRKRGGKIIIHFFFNARGEDLEKSTVGMYRSLLSQLLERIPSLLDTLEVPGSIARSGEDHHWNTEILTDLLEQAIQNLEGFNVLCFIDALDECEEDHVRDMIRFFETVGESITAGTFRPLEPQELYFALLSNEMYQWNTEEITLADMGRFILDSSKGLAETTNSKAPTVQFIHESVKDYLLKEDDLKQIWSDLGANYVGESHNKLKRCCLDYITLGKRAYDDAMDLTLKASSSEAKAQRKAANGSFPFLQYAVKNIWHHANEAQAGNVDQADFLRTFQLSDWVRVDNFFAKHDTRRHRETVSIVYILAENDAAHLTKLYPARSFVAEESDQYGPPIFAAFATDSREAVRAMLDAYVEREPSFRGVAQYFHRNEAKQSGIGIGREFKFRSSLALEHISRRGATLAAVFYLTLKHRGLGLNTHSIEALLYAVKGGQTSMVEYFFENGVHPEPGSEFIQELLTFAIAERREQVAAFLLNNGATFDPLTKEGRSFFRVAAEGGMQSILEILLRRAERNMDCEVQVLLGKGAMVDTEDQQGRTPLSYASQRGGEKTVKRLLKSHAPVDARDHDGRTPLSYASKYGHAGVVGLLLDKCADINAKDDKGNTPLIYATSYRRLETIKLLIKRGADIRAKNNQGSTPLRHAKARGLDSSIQKMLKGSPKVDHGGGGKSALR